MDLTYGNRANNFIRTLILFLFTNFCFAQTWSPVGDGMLGGYVNTMCVYDSALYVGGTFIGPGSHIAEWNGNNWLGVGGGINNDVYVLCAYKNNLYAGGYFSNAGGYSAGGFAEWSGANWNAVDPKFQHIVSAMDTSNNLLFYCDDLHGVYTWNGKVFQTVLYNTTNAIINYNDTMYVTTLTHGITSSGYYFIVAGSLYKIWPKVSSYQVKRIANFLSRSNACNLYSLAVYNNKLYIGGSFDTVNHKIIHNLAVYNGSFFVPAGNINGTVNALSVYNGKLYAGGYFDSVGTIPANNIACWNDTTWSALGEGVNNAVFSIVPFNGDLYVGGGFTEPGNYIAKYSLPKPDTTKHFNTIRIFPNPNKGLFSIGVPDNMVGSIMFIYNAFGQNMGEYSLKSNVTELNMRGSSAGIYVYRINTNNGDKFTAGRFIIY